MVHKEYKRINPDADVAVLFIHGILGTPNHFDEFVSLVPDSVSVCNLLLDGHGKGVGDFSRTSMAKWEAQVSSAVEELSLTHNKIYIAAHSMGSLLAIEQALKSKKISGLFLLAVPLKLSLKFKMVSGTLKVYFDRIRPDDLEALAAKRCCGVNHSKNPFKYIGWVPRFFELFAKMRKVRKTIHLLDADCYAYQSGKDEMVSKRSIKYLIVNSRVSVHELRNSGHYYYDKKDLDFLIGEFVKMLSPDVFTSTS